MTRKGYTVLGWLAWQLITRIVKPKIAQNKVKIGAAATVFAVLVGGVLAAKASSGQD
jgi:predicted PurR-regulated permease PerM